MSEPASPVDRIGTERPPLEVADVVRAQGASFLVRHGPGLATAQRRALADVAACRTVALGGHVHRCGACGHEAIAYNSCRMNSDNQVSPPATISFPSEDLNT